MTDRQTDRQTDKQTNKQTDERQALHNQQCFLAFFRTLADQLTEEDIQMKIIKLHCITARSRQALTVSCCFPRQRRRCV